MRKIINDPRNFVNEVIVGILEAHADQIKCVNDNLRCLVRSNEKKSGKVGLLTGGGSGHLPLFLGYVGR